MGSFVFGGEYDGCFRNFKKNQNKMKWKYKNRILFILGIYCIVTERKDRECKGGLLGRCRSVGFFWKVLGLVDFDLNKIEFTRVPSYAIDI